jgi:hypothetical protein
MADETVSSNAPSTLRRPYGSPRCAVIFFGSLGDLTQALGKTSNSDGGTGTKKRSKP